MDIITTQPVSNTPQPEVPVPEATVETPLSDEEKEEKRRRREECCCYYLPDEDEMCFWCYLCRCIADCFYTIGQCTESGFEGCANCCNDCCESPIHDAGDSGGCLDCCHGCGDSPDAGASGSLDCTGCDCDCDDSI